MDWIKNIAGIIFGGGMLIKFIERIYKKRDDKQRIYRQIYDTIVAYQKDLENLLFTYLKYVISTSDEMKDINIELRNINIEISDIAKQLESLHKIFDEQKNINENHLIQYRNLRTHSTEIYQYIDELKDKSKSIAKLQDEYWYTNSEEVHNVIDKYQNIYNALYLIGKNKKNNDLFLCINKIDMKTMNLFKNLLNIRKVQGDFYKDILTQLSNLEDCLEILSKKL